MQNLYKIQETVLGNLLGTYFIRHYCFSLPATLPRVWATLLYKGADRKWQPIVVR